MNETMDEIFNEERYNDREMFVADTLDKVTWCVEKRHSVIEKCDSLTAVCDANINYWLEKKERIKEKARNQLDNFNFLIEDYFNNYAPAESISETKTMFKCDLPNASLQRKKGTLEFKRDNPTACKSLKEAKLNDFIRTKEEVDWEKLKQKITVVDSMVVYDGIVIDGITVEQKPDTFVIKEK